MSDQNYRLYSFVANGYLSPLQCGLQTAHAVGDMSVKYKVNTKQKEAYEAWAAQDKVIIICAAFNSKGVKECFDELVRTGDDALCLPTALFCEDEDSLNGAATACAVVVPQQYWDVQFFEEADTFDKFGQLVKHTDAYWEHALPDGKMIRYPLTHPEGQFIDHIKKYRLA
jgi:hypothetical protein